MASAALGAAVRYGMPMAIDAAKGFFAGKQAENIGGHNESQSAQDRLKARMMNEDPNAVGQRGAESTEQSKNAAQGRTRADTIFSNQLDASNKRADLQNQMTLNDQVIATNRGTQLANNYLDASNAQANTSANLAAAILGRQATNYQASQFK